MLFMLLYGGSSDFFHPTPRRAGLWGGQLCRERNLLQKSEIYAAMFFFHNFHINIPNAQTINSVKTITTQNAEEWESSRIYGARTPASSETRIYYVIFS
jgi:hypothetical protein